MISNGYRGFLTAVYEGTEVQLVYDGIKIARYLGRLHEKGDKQKKGIFDSALASMPRKSINFS